MTLDELNGYLVNNSQVEWAQDDDGNLYLRHAIFDGEHEKLKIEPRALKDLTVEKLEKLLVGGRNIDHITRVTGYFSRVSGWNKGKRAELVDRQRVQI
ncbi:MAG: anaerobic ribonucleoside-triphosphate reductase [Candidatus Margulisbacteria bacterium]|nr:anaerobic ribonucleoside-triphosphate reductase [Candidatus Margulisiibacteriota bacterium]MBU1022379.1 anaerobic ribonucleoside-triphosphate reductase [Candidatus Margulisiibacteriota bacterium]MBU1729069.1 anaerobic ribonucleoside-triphosphate reductase [Candidatus Margulisiibacteriota bacterium]MBU1954510.1 anaerobic ribonucleoside-triphosphate reductase [Candidatus Margulisiibacteriota bacterium]